MGRSIESVRQRANRMADRWARETRALKREDRQHGEMLVVFAKKRSSEAFMGCDDALEAVLFSSLVEILIHRDRVKPDPGNEVNP
nr:hypothetical protein [uncultured Methanoregula sp.]